MDNSEVFDNLYNTHKSSLYGLACYLTRNRREAEDLFQETWLRVARHLASRPVDEDNGRAWILTIASNLYKDSLRKKRVRQAFLLQKQFLDQKSREECRDQRTDTKIALSRALENLPSQQRLIFVLKEIEGFKYSEIGEMLHLPEGTVKSVLHRAVKRLRKELCVFHPNKTMIASV